VSHLVPRAVAGWLRELAANFRIVIVNGPRQAGKTTLLKQFQRDVGGTYVTLDNESTLEDARQDLRDFVRRPVPRPLIIDEIQRGGDSLILEIKMVVDQSNDRGQFILSGSSNFLTIPTLSESLAGRAVFVDLWPLSMAERTEAPLDTLDRILTDPAVLSSSYSIWSKSDYLQAIVAGGYPEAIPISSPRIKESWYSGYLDTVILRDIRDFARLQDPPLIHRLLRLIAARAGSALVLSDLASSLEVDRATIRNYLSYLNMVFLTVSLPPWIANLTIRSAKTPKTFLADTGLQASLMDAEVTDLLQLGHPALGSLVEGFVFTELLRQREITETRFRLYQYRTDQGREVDFVLECGYEKIIAIEVKASTNPPTNSDQHLRWLKEKLGDRMVAGLVLHMGDHGGSRGNGIYWAPISALWGNRELKPHSHLENQI
jgi:uncharacterized protein